VYAVLEKVFTMRPGEECLQVLAGDKAAADFRVAELPGTHLLIQQVPGQASGDLCDLIYRVGQQGWCQYGSPEELPGIKHKREYDKAAPPPPDWRITCFLVDKKHRGHGIARAALEGALDQIAHLGGGLVEAISEVTAGREAQDRFLFSATIELFEQNGFTRVRQVGKHAWIVSKVIQPA
jgi:GNAT superfamily N-acetyltransferase